MTRKNILISQSIMIKLKMLQLSHGFTVGLQLDYNLLCACTYYVIGSYLQYNPIISSFVRQN
jgi:hypothetical protein